MWATKAPARSTARTCPAHEVGQVLAALAPPALEGDVELDALCDPVPLEETAK
jgi:hypothetical protein